MYVLEIYSILFDRPSHLTLEQAASIIHDPQTHLGVTYRIAAHRRQSNRYAISLFEQLNPETQGGNNIEVVKHTGERRPAFCLEPACSLEKIGLPPSARPRPATFPSGSPRTDVRRRGEVGGTP